jgi:signal transduction histidine kinase
MIIKSLRVRLLVASIFWTFGLLGLAHGLFILLLRWFPHIFRINLHALVIVPLLCVSVGLWMLRSMLKRLAVLQSRMSAVREGKDDRITGEYPSEIDPLVRELNALLAHREEVVRRALTKAGDLAHGLKTPLAVIAHESDSPVIREQLERMQRQIDVHLAHARAAGAAATLGARTVVAESVDALIRTLERLHAARGIAMQSRVVPSHAVRVQREDLDEMLGNLLDNACKWARSRITVGSMVSAGRVIIVVDDDGPGVDASLREAVLQRGVRADEAAHGSGLGLGIVRDLAELYGGAITLDASPAGGLSARLELPSAN